MISITHSDWYTIKGRGEVFVATQEDNLHSLTDLKVGDVVHLDGQMKKITGIEIDGKAIGIIAINDDSIPLPSKFKIGDKVKRRGDVMNMASPYRHGRVIREYPHRGSRTSYFYPEVYEVEWADGQVESGFLPHGLERDHV